MAHLLRYPSQLPMRPINKETETVELDQLFESYVETDLFQQLTTSAADPSGPDDLAHLFDLPSSNENDLFGFTPILHRESEPWHKATQLGSQNPSSSSDSVGSSVNHSHLRGKSTSSDSDTLSFEDLFELEKNQLRSTSQPSTPRPTTATSTSTSTTSKCIKKAQSTPAISRGVQKTLRKCPSSSFAKTAKMMQPSYYRAPVPHMWTARWTALLTCMRMFCLSTCTRHLHLQRSAKTNARMASSYSITTNSLTRPHDHQWSRVAHHPTWDSPTTNSHLKHRPQSACPAAAIPLLNIWASHTHQPHQAPLSPPSHLPAPSGYQ